MLPRIEIVPRLCLSTFGFHVVINAQSSRYFKLPLRHYPKQNVCFACFASIPKQRVLMFLLNRKNRRPTETVWKRAYLDIFRKFRVVSVCFGCFDIVSKQQNKLKQTEFFLFNFGFTKQTETQPKQILFRFVWVRTRVATKWVSGYFAKYEIGRNIRGISRNFAEFRGPGTLWNEKQNSHVEGRRECGK